MNEIIRVLQVGLTSNRGGVESFVMNIYRKIDRSKIQFDFLVDHDKTLPYEDEIKQMGGRIYHEYYNMKDEIPGKTVRDFFLKHPEISAVHLNLNNLNTYFRVLTVAKKVGIQTRIIHSHNNGYMFKYNIKQKLYEQYAKLFMKRYATHFFACSNEAGRWMFGKNTKYQVVPNAIDIYKFKYDVQVRELIRIKQNIKAEEIVVGFVGSLNQQKDPLFLIEILCELKKISSKYKLMILGQGYLYEEVTRKIQDYNLQESVILMGNVSNVEDYLQAMDLFVLPSKFEGFGIVLIEAQAAGLKCVTSKGVVPKDTNVTGEVQFLLKSDGPSKWARYIADMPIERINPTALQCSLYNIDNIIDEISEIYVK